MDYLVSNDTLRQQAGMSLDERAALFMNHFPGKQLTGGRLSFIYRKYGVKFKKIRMVKQAPAHRMYLIPQQIQTAFALIEEAR